MAIHIAKVEKKSARSKPRIAAKSAAASTASTSSPAGAPTETASKRVRKEPITIRLDPDVLAACRALGAGWQPQVNAMLRKVFKL